jgi:hypothetical protein
LIISSRSAAVRRCAIVAIFAISCAAVVTVLTPAAKAITVRCDVLEVWEGNASADVHDDDLDGVIANDLWKGNNGDDTLGGMGCGDSDIAGNLGADTIRAGDGDDVVHGYGGDDSLYGGANFDVLAGGDNADSLYDVETSDSDDLSGGDNGDFIDVNDDDIADTASGEGGNDTCVYDQIAGDNDYHHTCETLVPV